MHDLLMEEVEQLRKPNYSPQYNLVLREIANCFNWNDGYAWPSAKYIARRTWISEGQVRTIIRVLRKDGVLDVTPRDQDTHEFRFPYLSQKVQHLLPDALSSEAGPAIRSGGGPLLSELVPTIPGAVTHCSKSSRTVNEESSSAFSESEPIHEPYRTVSGNGSVTSPSQRTDLTETEIQNRIKSAASTMEYFFPDCKLEDADLYSFVQRQDFEPKEFGDIIHWAVGKSNGKWEEQLLNSQHLAFWYAEIKRQWTAFYDTVREKNGGHIPAKALPRPIFREPKRTAGGAASQGVEDPSGEEVRRADEFALESEAPVHAEDGWDEELDFGSFDITEEELDG